MITLTRLNDRPFVLNSELIKTIEETPDTVITLVGGDKLMVREAVRDVVSKAIEYARQVRSFRAE
jgi:flagellar protein FlbD